MALYTITDLLGIIPFCFVLSFGAIGLYEWVKRKSLFKVDCEILVLGGFYIVVLLVYIFFEFFVINYRPILINGVLEVSYPSSTTLLITCVMPTVIIRLKKYIKNNILKRCVSFIIYAFIAFMVIGRFFSGVHWFSDIVGGTLLSTGLVMIYSSICEAVS